MVNYSILWQSKDNLFVDTFPMGLCFNYLTNASWPHCILGCESKLVPGATLEVLQPIWALTGTDRKVPPLLAVILRVLQNVAWKRTCGQTNVNEQPAEKKKEMKSLTQQKKKNRAVSAWPLMELPPLSPGIQDRVIEVVVVLVTVRRGWSGGTEEKKTDRAHKWLIIKTSLSRKNVTEKLISANKVCECLNTNPQVQHIQNTTCV